jgi:3-oxoacyl-[acyl-carrier-protein] synthase-1
MSSTAATLATWFKIKGVNYSISSACATSNHCIGNAYETDPVGKQDIDVRRRLRGSRLDALVLFDAMGAMSSGYNDTPAVASRAYDANRDGFVIAGGAGVLVLEELEHAKARGAKIYARSQATARPRTATTWCSLPAKARSAACGWRWKGCEGAGRLHQSARDLDAGRRPEGNRSDPRSVRRQTTCPPIAATKSLTGHSLGAAGVQEAIYSLLMMNNGFICESAHIDEIDPEFADLPIVRKRIDNANLGTVLSNSFGFGGTNATLVFKKLDA